MTALIIQNRDDILVTCAGPGPNGKYAGWILLDVDRRHPLLNTDFDYDSPALAEKAMWDSIEQIRKMDVLKEAEMDREREKERLALRHD